MEKASNKKVIIYCCILVAAITILGLMGAYGYAVVVSSKNQEVNVNATGDLKLTYTDCDTSDVSTCANINKDLAPGESVEKIFEVNNTSTRELSFTLYFQELLNTFKSDDLVYKLENITTNEVLVDETPLEYAEATVYNSVAKSDIKIDANTTNKYRLTIKFLNRDRNQNENLNAKYMMKVSIKECKKTLVQALLEKTNDVTVTDYNVGVKGEMFTFTHPEAEQTTGWSEEERTDYRYIGNTPNNYINFNNETWRIIGVFTVENETSVKEQRIKIIREASIGTLPWDSVSSVWPTSSLATMLNEDYVNSGGSFTYTWYHYTGASNDSIVQGLNSTAKSQITPTKWYLAGPTTEQNLGGVDYYNFERGTTVSSRGESTNWIANVGLMYPSDYAYTFANGIDNTCYTNGYGCRENKFSSDPDGFVPGIPSTSWLYNSLSTSNEWLLTPSPHLPQYVFYRLLTGSVREYYLSSNYDDFSTTYEVRPCVYLRSDIRITGGDGASAETAYTINVPTN